MSVQQAEYVAFKKDVAASIAKLEEVVTKTNFDAAAASTVIAELQNSYAAISVQAAPWSAAIQAEVAASESKASAALADVKRLYEITKAEVEDLRRRATEVENRSPTTRRASGNCRYRRISNRISSAARTRRGPSSRTA